MDFEQLLKELKEIGPSERAISEWKVQSLENTPQEPKHALNEPTNRSRVQPAFFIGVPAEQLSTEEPDNAGLVTQSPTIRHSNTAESLNDESASDLDSHQVPVGIEWRTASGKILDIREISVSSEEVTPKHEEQPPLSDIHNQDSFITVEAFRSKTLDLETACDERKHVDLDDTPGCGLNPLEISDGSPPHERSVPCILSQSKLETTSGYFENLHPLEPEIKALKQSDLETLGSINNIVHKLSETDLPNKKIINRLMAEDVKKIEGVLLRFCAAQQGRKHTDPNPIYMMTLTEMLMVSSVWNDNKFQDDILVVEHPHVLEKLTVRNMRTLQSPNWLNDEVINAYIRLVDKRLVTQDSRLRVMNSFFFEELVNPSNKLNKFLRILGNKSVDIKTLDNLVIPINTAKSHWSFIDVDFTKGSVTLYDSLPTAYIPNQDLVLSRLNMLQQERSQRGGGPLIPLTKAIKAKKFGKQVDPANPHLISNDCGVFLLRGVRCLALEHGRINFAQEEAEYLRYLICFELMRGALQL